MIPKACKDIPTKDILEYLYERQCEWTCLWNGFFDKDGLDANGIPYRDPIEYSDVYYAMPKGTIPKLALRKMQILYKAGLVGGCGCGCRGDFEITDKGLEYLDKPRLKDYTGY